MNCRIRSSNWSEAKHNSRSTSLISIPAWRAGIQLTRGIRLMTAEMKLNVHILFRKSLGSIPGITRRNNGRIFVGADGRCSLPHARGRTIDVMHIKVAVTWCGSTRVSSASKVLRYTEQSYQNMPLKIMIMSVLHLFYYHNYMLNLKVKKNKLIKLNFYKIHSLFIN